MVAPFCPFKKQLARNSLVQCRLSKGGLCVTWKDTLGMDGISYPIGIHRIHMNITIIYIFTYIHLSYKSTKLWQNQSSRIDPILACAHLIRTNSYNKLPNVSYDPTFVSQAIDAKSQAKDAKVANKK